MNESEYGYLYSPAASAEGRIPMIQPPTAPATCEAIGPRNRWSGGRVILEVIAGGMCHTWP